MVPKNLKMIYLFDMNIDQETTKNYRQLGRLKASVFIAQKELSLLASITDSEATKVILRSVIKNLEESLK